MPEEHHPDLQRHQTLTQADLDAITRAATCPHPCKFTEGEAEFVKSWMQTTQTAKNEIVKWLVKGFFWFVGLVALIMAAWKLELIKKG